MKVSARRGLRIAAFTLACVSSPPAVGCAAGTRAPEPGGPPHAVPAGTPAMRDVLVIERIDCHPEGGAAMLFLRGRLMPGEGVRGESRVRLSERLFARYRPERTGIDSADWYCIPRRRLCYSAIGFSDHRGTSLAGDVVDASPKDVFDVRRESVPTLAATEYARRCE